MPDDVIRNALAQRDEIRARIDKFERGIRRAKGQLTDIEKFISQWEKFSGRSVDAEKDGIALEVKQNSKQPLLHSEPKNPRKEEVAENARAILKESGKPLTRSELFQRLVEDGVIIRGGNPEMILSTMLWRTKEHSGIVRLKGGGYCLQEAANPEDMDEEQDSDSDSLDE